MSTIGKTFSVINLVLAALFLGWAATTLDNNHQWKKQHDAAVAAAEKTQGELNAALDALGIDRDKERTQKDQYLGEKNDATAEVERLRTELQEQKDENSQLRGSITNIENTLGDYQQNNRDLETAKTAAVEGRHAAELERDAANSAKDAAELAQREAEADLARAQARIEELDDELVARQSDLSKLDTQLTVALEKANLTRSEVQSAQPYISGSVLSAIYDVEPGMVALNVGSNDGVKIGHTFEIYRNRTYKGRVRVTHVRDGNCSALVINLVPGQTIAQGDSAETNLSL